jgi:hypothetical protein
MSDFLTRMLERATGRQTGVKPILAPVFASVPAPDAGGISDRAETITPSEEGGRVRQWSQNQFPLLPAEEAHAMQTHHGARLGRVRRLLSLTDENRGAAAGTEERTVPRRDDLAEVDDATPARGSTAALFPHDAAKPRAHSVDAVPLERMAEEEGKGREKGGGGRLLPEFLSPDSNAAGATDDGAAVSAVFPRRISPTRDDERFLTYGRPVGTEHVPQPSPAVAQAPTIRISIGRVEVRAALEQSRPAPPTTPRAPKMSLDDYLNKQRGGKR